MQGFAAGAFQEDLGAFAFGEARHLHGDGTKLVDVFGQQGGDAVADVVEKLVGFGLGGGIGANGSLKTIGRQGK